VKGVIGNVRALSGDDFRAEREMANRGVISQRRIDFWDSTCGACGTGFCISRSTKNARTIDSYGQWGSAVVSRKTPIVLLICEKMQVGELGLRLIMEDRITPVLYLEMTDRPPAQYAAARVPEVLALPGVQRATWWANCVPFREDLPRTLPEFAVLGVYEADRDFEAPKGAGSIPDDITGYCFDHYGRPGQGTLSDKPTLGIELVLISAPTADQSQTLRDWGDFIHIRDIAAASPPHFTMITPYENRARRATCTSMSSIPTTPSPPSGEWPPPRSLVSAPMAPTP
jgi:hypothetical protein